MKTTRLFVVVFVGIGALLAALNAPLGAQGVTLTVDASRTGAPIGSLMYSYFSEPATTSMWAEMLGDRKFFYAVDSKDLPPPPFTTPGPAPRRAVARWRPIGSDEFVSMDRQHAYVGEHSPVVRLEGSTPHGFQQTGLALRTGRKYTGRVVLAAEPGADVRISLVWGVAPGDRQTIRIPAMKREYTKFPLSFTAQADSDDGRIEIVGTGTGSFHVGAVSLMPADNLRGYRADVIAALKQLRPAMIRWPGGDFVSQYDWRDGIGDADKRPPATTSPGSRWNPTTSASTSTWRSTRCSTWSRTSASTPVSATHSRRRRKWST